MVTFDLFRCLWVNEFLSSLVSAEEDDNYHIIMFLITFDVHYGFSLSTFAEIVYVSCVYVFVNQRLFLIVEFTSFKQKIQNKMLADTKKQRNLPLSWFFSTVLVTISQLWQSFFGDEEGFILIFLVLFNVFLYVRFLFIILLDHLPFAVLPFFPGFHFST